MEPFSNNILDNYQDHIEELRDSGKSNREIASIIGLTYNLVTSESSVRRAFKRWERAVDKTNVSFSGDHAEIKGPVEKVITDPQTLMKEFGVDPDEWAIERVTVNRWGNVLDPSYQLKAQLKRLQPLELVLPAQVPNGYSHDRNFRTPGQNEPKLVVMCGDQQAPFFDVNLHRLFRDWLAHNQPHEGVLIGDTLDLTEISRHRHKPEWVGETQKCINSGYGLLLDYVTASEGTLWHKLPGNHDDRIRNTIIDNNRDLYGLRRADIPGRPQDESVFELNYLLRLDELGIEYVYPQGTYDHAQFNVSQKLAARHGHVARKKSGASVYETLAQLTYSLAMGHTHRQAVMALTKPDIDGELQTYYGAEIGCMCQVYGGLGYDPTPDWQQGFMASYVWPDGEFTFIPAFYTDGILRWGNQRYE